MSEMRARAVAPLTGGIIGGGCAARFVLSGVDMWLRGPAAGAVRHGREILANTRRAYRRLTQDPLPAYGLLRAVNSVGGEAHGVGLMQESAPKRLASKGARGSDLRGARDPDLDRPERLFVAQAFNLAYLRPLVELCIGQGRAREAPARAAEIYRTMGRHPLPVAQKARRVDREAAAEAAVDGARRLDLLQEIATRSCRVRSAIMGPFRVGAGMRQLLAKWGRWGCRLADVPELAEASLDKLAEESDARAKNPTVPKLQRKRDECLATMLPGGRAQGYNAREALAGWEQG